jgi:L-aspartate oxidase
MGGVDTDEWGRTSLPGLFAAGEVACTGVHGANRLASNSLLEGLVFGARAGVAMQQTPQAAPLKADRIVAGDWSLAPGQPSGIEPPATSPQPPERPLEPAAIRDLMWRSAGLFRTREGLQGALARLDVPRPDEPRHSASIGDAEAWRQSHLATVALLMARAALRREESRGGHFRADFPQRDDLHWKVHLVDSYDHHVEKR